MSSSELSTQPAIQMKGSFFNEEPMFLYDFNTYRILDVNQTALQKYGYSMKEFRQMKITDLGEQIRFESYSDPDIEKSNPQSIWKQNTRHGHTFFVQFTSHLMSYSGQPVKLAVAHDITSDLAVMKTKPHLFPRIEIHTANLPLAVIEWDSQFRVRDWLGKAVEIFGWEFGDVYGKNMFEMGMIPKEHEESIKAELLQFIDRRTPYFNTELETYTEDGRRIHCEWNHSAVYSENGNLLAIYSMVNDVTARKRAKEKIQSSLKEKEILLAEIHHRVKNNLAVITGLLELQSLNTENGEAKEILQDSQMRIISMAMIHEKLYQNENLSQIQFNQYIDELIEVIHESHTTSDNRVNFQIDSDQIQLPITQAIPCGLLLNEIVTNSLKHAFPDNRNNEISILLKVEKQQILFEISDNGIGLPNDFESLESQSLGMTLIRTLSDQLHATLKIGTGPGTTYSLLFQYNQPDSNSQP